ncbi:MAG: 1-deoxy-D-xylulose-5-phosphate reductoisomerase [Planctomycetota bacterium]
MDLHLGLSPPRSAPRSPHALQKRLLVLGSTGSIGTQTLDLVASSEAELSVAGIAARSSWEAVRDQVQAHRPQFVAMIDPSAADALEPHLPAGTVLFRGPDALLELVAATDFDVCVHGVVGAAGLAASVAVLERGKTLALANKESLVLAGSELMQLARSKGAEIVPVDSEHSAIFQCLRGENIERVRKVWLTASGGPFRTTSLEDMRNASPEQALAHPTWEMGKRISIGSATLLNKALEVIELHHLFDLDADRIGVVVHPQSIVHSMVEFVDGSVIAQLGPPDMRGPIHFAIHHPDRAPAKLTGFDIGKFSRLTFEEPDFERFPTLGLGFRCVELGEDAGAVLNAADEVAVEAFLDGRLPFHGLYEVHAAVLDQRPRSFGSVEALLAADAKARELAHAVIQAGAPYSMSNSNSPTSL